MLLLDQVDGDVDAGLLALCDPSAGFPSPLLVGAAAALFVRDGDLKPGLFPATVRLAASLGYSQTPGALDARGRRVEGRDFLVQVAGGVVGVRMVDHERRARTESRYSPGLPGGRVDEHGRWVPWTVAGNVVTQWSPRSRARMTRTLSELDYAPLFAAGRPPAMLTLTYPGDWLAVAPSGKAVKGHVRTLVRRWHRAWGVWPPYLWKLEFQRRGAPHLHLFAVPELGDVACGCGCCRDVDFRVWLSHTWADIVAADDRMCLRCAPALGCRCEAGPDTERRRHRLAGTGVDWREGTRARDPKRLAVYFTKHGGAAGGKEYQHSVPLAWRVAGAGPGRFWGYCGLRKVRAEVYVALEEYIAVRRTLRRLSRSRRLSRTSRVPRVDVLTGELRWRTVTRRLAHLDHGGLAGGFLLVNDGPAVAGCLSRLHESVPVRCRGTASPPWASRQA